MLYQKKLSSKLNYLTKYHSHKKESFSTKMLNSKNALSQKYPQQQKEPCGKKNLVEFCKKKFQKKISQKKFQKKLKKGYQDFHAPK